MILNDIQIAELARDGMIRPFVGQQVREDENAYTSYKVISYGLSSYGYDLQLDEHLGLFSRTPYGSIDPKNFEDGLIEYLNLEYAANSSEVFFTLPQFGSALGHSVETLHLPDDVFALCVGKSTYARCGLIVNTTPLEPGWRGQLVIEIHNTTPLPIRIYANEGIAQLVFFKGDRPAVTYGDRAGKYQGQTGITTARI
jgi:dCTP deaminase